MELGNELGLGEKNRLNTGRGQGREDRVKPQVPQSDRPTRVPFHEQRTALNDKLIPDGYHGHWFADKPAGRLAQALNAGYNFVNKNGQVYSDLVTESGIDSRVSKSGSDDVTLYLMVIPLELYEADQAAKNAKAKEATQSILEPLGNAKDFYARKDGSVSPVAHGVSQKIENLPFIE